MLRMWLNLATGIKDGVDWYSSDDRDNVLVSIWGHATKRERRHGSIYKEVQGHKYWGRAMKKRKRKETRKLLNNWDKYYCF